MAIAFDANSASSIGVTATNTKTWAHVCTGNQLILIVVVIHSGFTSSVSTLTYAGASLTELYHSGRLEVWYKIGPATGTNNIVLTLNVSTSWEIFGATSWSGVDQLTPFRTGAGSAGTSTTPSVAVTAGATRPTVDMVFGALALPAIDPDAAITEGAGQTMRLAYYINHQDTFVDRGQISSEPGPVGGGSVTISYTLGGSRGWLIYAVPMIPYQRLMGAPAVSPVYML